MYYFHRHTEDSHTLVICDAMTSHADFPGHASFEYRESQDQFTDLEAITEWRHTHELTPGKVTLKDYDFTKPATDLKVEHASGHDTAPAVLEHYDYPGLYTESSRGSNLARVRQQELDARVLRVQGFSTTVSALCVGYRFALTKHPLASENTDHVVLSTRIEMQYSGYESRPGRNAYELPLHGDALCACVPPRTQHPQTGGCRAADSGRGRPFGRRTTPTPTAG